MIHDIHDIHVLDLNCFFLCKNESYRAVVIQYNSYLVPSMVAIYNGDYALGVSI